MSGGSRSKAKGNAGELQLCKLLSGVFGGSFVRVPASGAFVGGKNAARKATLSETQNRMHRGDIVPPDTMPKLVIEAKFYKEFRFHQLIQPGVGNALLDGWIKQSLDAVMEGDEWFIMFKINGKGWFVAVPEEQCGEYSFGSHVVYHGHWVMRVTELTSFLDVNRETVLRRCA